MTLCLPAGTTDINPDNESHQKSHKPRRGRFRHANDGNQSSQQHAHFNQCLRSSFSHDSSSYAGLQNPHHQDENLSRRRGRGRRDGNRGVNGSSIFQPPGEDHLKFRGEGLVEGPDATNWRRDPDRNVDQTSEPHDGQIKKPRKYSQEQRGRRQNERGPRLKEDNVTDQGQRSNHAKAEGLLAARDRTRREREEGSDVQYNEQWRKHPGVKRRQGPIKPARPLSQEDSGPVMEAAGGQQFSQVFSDCSHDAFRSGRGSGRYTSSQPRGGRRTHPPSQRPGLKNWDKVPESKETQTGQTQTSFQILLFKFWCQQKYFQLAVWPLALLLNFYGLQGVWLNSCRRKSMSAWCAAT